ncbi:MAG: thiamine pyrophosphate-binding protein, partial [Eubacterium sp.]|nr:thiamine pyrophosphate-binding protein [Eubacterium sp.]
LPEDYTTVVGNGSACVVGSQAYRIKKGTRFIINSAVASMGYDLPAAIGVSIAKENKEIVCISGDGSIQMNLQELQTIITNRLPVKLFVINNGGYHSIRQTQKNFFKGNYAGIGKESGDLEFPDLEKLAWAYGYPYAKCMSNSKMDSVIEKAFENEGAFIAEIVVGTTQFFEPKASSKVLENGKMVSMPLEELAPFLPDDEIDKNMIVPRVKHE